jgi:hypothetical protein
MREFWPFLKALFRYWWWVASSAAFGIISEVAQTMHWAIGGGALFAFAILFLFVAAFFAWRKEYLASVSGPLVLLRWHSKPDSQDSVELINQDSETAFEISLGDFSYSGLKWHRRIQIPHLDPKTSRTVPAEFERVLPGGLLEVNYLRGLLAFGEASRPAEALTIPIRYRNVKGTWFRLKFELYLVQVGRDSEVECRPGKLEIHR